MKKALGLFAAAACLSGAVASTQIAEAKWTRNTPWSCALTGGSILDTNFAPHNDSTASPVTAICPIDDRDDLMKHTITNVTVHGLDANPSAAINSNAIAMACESNFDTSGGACGAQVSSSFGEYALTPSLANVWFSGWPDEGWFGYLWVSIPVKHVSGTRSNFRGYFIGN
jgi:hypothetical protein